MKITGIDALEIEDIKVIRFARFCDHRGYFTERFRKSDFANHQAMDFMKRVEFVQCNESLIEYFCLGEYSLGCEAGMSL